MEPKLCAFCEDPEKPLADRRRNVHPECRADQANRPRRCKKCKEVKSANNFSLDASREGGRFPWCKHCQNSYAQANAFQDDEAPLNGFICPLDDVPIRGHKNRRFCSLTCKDRAGELRTKYGLSVEDFRRMVAATGGKCPICGDRPTVWQVDHNHKTRLTTGVVCINCNVGLLAHSRHDLDRVRNLLRYLLDTPASQLGIVALAPVTEANLKIERNPNLHKVWRGKPRRSR